MWYLLTKYVHGITQLLYFSLRHSKNTTNPWYLVIRQTLTTWMVEPVGRNFGWQKSKRVLWLRRSVILWLNLSLNVTLGRDPFRAKIPHILVGYGHRQTSHTLLVYMNWDILGWRCWHKNKYQPFDVDCSSVNFVFDSTQGEIIFRFWWHFYWKRSGNLSNRPTEQSWTK